jgi:hypothetical protein
MQMALVIRSTRSTIQVRPFVAVERVIVRVIHLLELGGEVTYRKD